MKSVKILGAALALGLVSQPVRAETTITLVAYSGLFQERYTKAVIEPFMKANPDIKVEYFPLVGSAQMLGTLRAQKASPQANVTIMDMSVAKTGTDEGLFDKVDEKVSPHVADLYPNARFDNIAGVGVTFDNLVMMYNAEIVKEPVTSWNDLKNKAYAGKVAMLGAPDLVGIGLTVIYNNMGGARNDLQTMEAGIKSMMEVAPNVQTWEPKPEVYPIVANGQAWLGIGWNARSQVNADNSGGRLKVVLPQEGSIFQVNTINLIKNAPNAEAARKFVDYALSPAAQKAFTEAMFYAPTNAKAQIAEAAIDRTAVKSMEKMMPLDWIALAKVRDGITEQWRRRVIPLSR